MSSKIYTPSRVIARNWKASPAAAAGMVIGHKLHKDSSSASIPNPYRDPACRVAWRGGVAWGMRSARNGLTFRQLAKNLIAARINSNGITLEDVQEVQP